MRILTVVWLTFFLAKAHGNILFLDLNHSESEVNMAKEAARKRGVSVKILPHPDSSLREAFLNAKYTMFLKKKTMNQTCETENGVPCDLATEEFHASEIEYVKVKGQTSLTRNNLKQQYASVVDGESIDTLVISGHDGTGDFYGVQGSLSFEDLEDLVHRHPELKDSVESLYLFGCYTTTPGKVQHMWKSLFPNLKYIAGFDLKGPSGGSPIGQTVIGELFRRQDELLTATHEDEVEELFQLIPKLGQTTAALYVESCGKEYFLKKHKTATLSERLSFCPEWTGSEADLLAKVDCYFRGKCKLMGNSRAKAEIREFYDWVQIHEHCVDSVERHMGIVIPEVDQLISLLFFDKVQINYGRRFADKLESSNELLEKLGVEINIPTFKKPVPRAEVIKLIEDLTMLAEDLPLTVENPQSAREKLLEQSKSLQDHLYDFKCTPFSWISTYSVDSSLCL